MASGRIRSREVDAYRMRFIYCSIGATLMCLGILILVAGLVVYILCTTSHHGNYVNDFFYHQHDHHSSVYGPIVIAIILASTGIAFITVSIVFTLLACLTHGRLDVKADYSPEPQNRAKGVPKTKSGHEEQRLIVSPQPTESEQTKNPSSSPKKYRVVETSIDLPPPPPNGDINEVGLPPIGPASQRRVPPNGFSYLVNPNQIQNYHENQRASRPSPSQRQLRNVSRESVI